MANDQSQLEFIPIFSTKEKREGKPDFSG